MFQLKKLCKKFKTVLFRQFRIMKSLISSKMFCLRFLISNVTNASNYVASRCFANIKRASLKASWVIPCFFRKYMRHRLLRLPTSFYLKQHYCKYIHTTIANRRQHCRKSATIHPTTNCKALCISDKNYS